MDLARDTLFKLSEHDWSQRYANSLINYDGRIWYVSSCFGTPPKMTLKDITVKNVADEDDDDGDGRDPKEKLESKIHFWTEEWKQYNDYIQARQPKGIVVDAAILRRFKDISNSLNEAKDKLAAFLALPPVVEAPVKRVLRQTIKIDPNKISLERPRAGWYSYVNCKDKPAAGYLYYKSEKQFSRGFFLGQNCRVFAPMRDVDWTDFSRLLAVACFGPKIGRSKVSVDDLLALKPGSNLQLSRQIMVQTNHQEEEMGLIYYRTKRIATYNAKRLVLSVPAFLDELREVCTSEPELGVENAGM